MLTLFIAAAALSVSFALEFLWKIPPCKLCLIQRFAYGTLFILSILATGRPKSPTLPRLIQINYGAILAVSVIHLLVIYQVIPDFCSRLSNPILSRDQYITSLLHHSNQCSRSIFSVFKLPLSLYSALLGVIGVFLFTSISTRAKTHDKEKAILDPKN